MKYFLAFLCVAAFAVENINGGFIDNEIRKLQQEAEKKLDKLVQPVLKDGQKLLQRLQKMQAQMINIANTTECQELQATLEQVNGIVNNIVIVVFNTTVTIGSDIQNIKTECVKQGSTLQSIVACVKKDFVVVYQAVENAKETIKGYNQQIIALSKTVQEQFQACLKSQVTTPKPTDAPTTAKPTEATTTAAPTKATTAAPTEATTAAKQ